LHNRSHSSRIRDKKRQVYHNFLEWIKDKDDLTAYPWTSYNERGGYKHNQEWFDRVYQTFPEFKNRFDLANFKFQKVKVCKTKFNGDIVSKLTGLTRIDLGCLMRSLKSQDKDIYGMTQDEINEWILSEYKLWSGTSIG
jgi:hypothetical protein